MTAVFWALPCSRSMPPDQGWISHSREQKAGMQIDEQKYPTRPRLAAELARKLADPTAKN